MCGIAGFAGQGSRDDLQRMMDAQVHRGPDAEGVWCDPQSGIYLGHRRLSILDLADGSQPMWSADGKLGVVFNGEIYNFRELRQELEQLGHVFRTDHSDTEVLLHGYREWGVLLTEMLNGMWAFALYDRERQILFCSRDRFGKKPFYYTLQNGTFAFASELSALLQHSALSVTISTGALKKYFGYGYIPAPHTLYSQVQKLPGGHSLVFSLTEQRCRVFCYWEFKIEPIESRPAGIEAQWQEKLRELLCQAVQRRLVSDVPIGVFLSGGLDSSAIAACAVKGKALHSLATFSIGFDDEAFDESTYAERVALQLGTQHYPATLSLERARGLLPQILGQLDEPLGDSSLLPTYLLCGHARQHVTVALGGDGADELFGGYAPFRALRWASLYQRAIPQPLHTMLQYLANRLPVMDGYLSLDFKLKRTLRGVGYPARLWNPLWMSTLSEAELAELFEEPVDLEDVFSEAVELWDSRGPADPVDRTLQYFTRLYLQDDILAKVDRASMMHSLEVRSPFLDLDLVNFVRRLPSDCKVRNGTTKYILKEALAPWLPAAIRYRSKHGFAVPVAKWFRDGGLPAAHLELPHAINRAFIKRKLADHCQRRVNDHMFLWSQWVLGAVAGRGAR
jgi:asparagine synthase (glutamine-hydrolysing)